MNCEKCQSMLMEFEHRELQAEARADVARHLAECSGCALAYCRLRADLEGLVAACTEAPGSDVRERLRKRVERTVRPSWWDRMVSVLRRPVPAYAAALAAGIPITIWAVAASNGPRQPDLPPPSAATITNYDGVTTRINAPGVL